MHKPELLAPVGSKEALIAAVENGADSVYFGGKIFSAQRLNPSSTAHNKENLSAHTVLIDIIPILHSHK